MKILTWQARQQKGMSLQQLSDATGIGKTTLNNIENQKVSPTLDQLELIATALNVKLCDLYKSEYEQIKFLHYIDNF